MNIPFISPVSPVHWFRRATLVAALFALHACSTTQDIGNLEHGLSVANKGDTRILDVAIQYGQIARRECTKGCPPRSGGGVWNAPMPIPDAMQVSWQTADGQQHQAIVPVKSRLKDARRLRTLYLEFNGDKLIIVQALAYDNPTIVEYEKFPLFP